MTFLGLFPQSTFPKETTQGVVCILVVPVNAVNCAIWLLKLNNNLSDSLFD